MILISLIGTTGLASNTSPSSAPAPRLAIDQNRADAGEFWFGCCGRVSWTLRNIGDAPLMLQARWSCCLSLPEGDGANRTIAPGANDELIFVVNPQPLGRTKLASPVVLMTNDPLAPRVELEFTFRIRSAVEFTSDDGQFEPLAACPWIRFQPLERSRAVQERVIRLSSGDAGPIAPRVRSVRVTPPRANVVAELRELVAGDSYEISVQYEPPWPTTSIAADLVIATGVESQPRMVIQTTVNIEPLVRIRRKHVPLRSPAVVVASEEILLDLQWPAGFTPPRLLSPATDIPGVGARVEEIDGRQQLVVGPVNGGVKEQRLPPLQLVVQLDEPTLGPLMLSVPR